MRLGNDRWREALAGFLSSRGHLIVLALLTGLALFFRLYGINWDQGGLYHPDERAILMRVNDLAFPTGNLSSLFSADSRLNPAWFPYGSLPLYLLKLTGYLAPPFLDNPSFQKLAIMGRATSAIFDVATVLLVYVVGARLFNRWAGLLGASFIALSALHIQQSHFFVTDIMLASVLMGSFFFLTRAMDSGRLKHFGLAAVFFGIALATKASAAPFALAFVAAAVLYVYRGGQPGSLFRADVRQAVKGVGLAGAVTLATFVIAQPYGVIDFKTFWGDVGAQGEMVRRVVDLPFTRQYIDTTPFLYQMRHLTIWGMGLPAGLLLWGGLLFSVVMAVRKRRREHILLLSWVAPYFLITGLFDVKFMRYMLPITPFLAIMGGALATWAVGWVRQHRSRFMRPELLYAALGVAMVFTLLYSIAYVRIYSRPHPAEAASAWINENVPAGATILQDSGWEEGFRNLWRYDQFRMEVYDPDTTIKRRTMVESLARTDYLLFYSNRQYGTIPRLPERYPLTTAYYDLLFSGQLGFDLVHWESSYPNLLGVSIADDTFGRPGLARPPPMTGYGQTRFTMDWGFADESFTVYDHPLILVFQKTIDGDPEEQRAFFDEALPQIVVPQRDAATGFGLLLSPEDAATQQAGGTWSQLFNRASFVNTIPAVVWFLVVQLAFLLALPITLAVFRRLPDRGYLLGKMLGVLLIAYVPWLLASLHWLDFSRLSIGVGLLFIAAVSAVILRFQWREMLDFLRRNARLILVGELLFLVAFLGLYGIRVWNPDLWHPFRGGEKPMDFAYFNAVVRSTTMPPYDPWFSGGYLNYYYFGQFMNATLTKFTGVMPSIAINLTVPLFFALMAGGVFSITYNLTTLAQRHLATASGFVTRMPSPIWAGLIAVVLVGVAGNLDGIIQFSQGIGRMFDGESFGAFDFWRSSRFTPRDSPGFEITEFPYFTFLFADPHAHLFVIPLTLLALGLAMTYVLEGGRGRGWFGALPIVPLALLGLTLGAILATNSWDVITYAAIGAAAVMIAEFGRRRGLSVQMAVAGLIKVALLAGLAALFFLPYIANYEPPITNDSESFWTNVPLVGGGANTIWNTFNLSEKHTRVHYYLGVHGLFIVVLISFLSYELWQRFGASVRGALAAAGASRTARLAAAARSMGWIGAAYVTGVIAAIAAAGATGYGTVALITSVLALLAPLVVWEVRARGEGSALRLLLYLVIAVPLLLGIVVDLFTFANDIGRMNTVFKFYLQAWVLLGIASAYALWRLRFGGVFSPRLLRWGWQAFMAALVAAVLIYPIMATPVRARDRFDTGIPPSANGMTFMDTASYHDGDVDTWLDLIWDREGIEWLQDNVAGSPVIVEGLTQLYRWGNRVSVYTGLPAVIGWDWHQKQQRWDYQWAVDQRRREVDAFFNTPSVEDAQRFLRRYNVGYVYVGQLEKAYYSEIGLNKFFAMEGAGLRIVFANKFVRIFEVAGG